MGIKLTKYDLIGMENGVHLSFIIPVQYDGFNG